ncbi:ABC transporter permease [Mycolicibacterium fluoranthenivorans]|uniref:Peptide/nickel transport system permease protein n=1 Tax=Mycolicibacterium fluoranthenivorans TaxID=258505 RepID=A0A7X5TYZ5_9MYCO|nr:ABC transporter permease [Mycolicibacterium fluoranthenivorans]MCV7357339.1 ABC transporter permease [Mycolicibacterium fluoranthenivorans]NIH95282.1 peptide/nickel transport system permease protein [Mycolicibacterium fluoranthenivorans]
MVRYLATKFVYLFLTLGAVLTTNFLIFHLMPGDPVTHIARGQHLDAAAVARLRTYYGLDRPLIDQFATYVSHLLHGDFGYSFSYSAPVGPIVADALVNTVILVTVSTVLVIALGVLIGVFAASRRGTRADRGLVVGSLVFWSLPTFWIGMLLIFVFAVALNWLPIAGMYTADAIYPTFVTRISDLARHLVLPTTAMVLVDIAQFVLITRSSLVSTLSEDFMTTARAKGLHPRRVLWRHGVRNALLPVVTATTLYASATVGGTIQVETVFSWPGMGQLIYLSVVRRDYPVMEACFLIFAVVVVLANFGSDVLYRALDPRVRLT